MPVKPEPHPGKEGHMRKGLILLALAALLSQACADMNGDSRKRDGSGFINWSNTCAMCGASVSNDYFAGSAFRAVGPGNY